MVSWNAAAILCQQRCAGCTWPSVTFILISYCCSCSFSAWFSSFTAALVVSLVRYLIELVQTLCFLKSGSSSEGAAICAFPYICGLCSAVACRGKPSAYFLDSFDLTLSHMEISVQRNRTISQGKPLRTFFETFKRGAICWIWLGIFWQNGFFPWRRQFLKIKAVNRNE